MKPVRWGILGAARIARTKVIPAMQRTTLCDVVALASRDSSRARDTASALGIPRTYGSYDELLTDPELDAVYIPLPNHLHVPWTKRAAEAGKHVLCEKPIALDAAEARELLAVREQTGVLIAEAFMIRCHPQWLRASELLRSGRIGEPRLVTGHFSYHKRDPNDIRSRPEYGGGALMDIGCYLIHAPRWLLGAEPLRVSAVMEQDPEFHVDRLTSALLEFPSAQAVMTCATQLAPSQEVTIHGDGGRIHIDVPFNAPNDRPCLIHVRDRKGAVGTIEIPICDQYALQGEAFSRAVRGAGHVPVTLEDSVHNMAVLDAVVQSGRRGTWVGLGDKTSAG